MAFFKLLCLFIKIYAKNIKECEIPFDKGRRADIKSAS
jgi:hypothetical protein